MAGHSVALSRTRIASFGVPCRDCQLRSRKLCYCGVAKNHAWLTRHTNSLNVRNLIGGT